MERFLASIMEKGLLKGQRYHVYLSGDIATACKVAIPYPYYLLLTAYSPKLYCANMWYITIPTLVARFKLRTWEFFMGMVKQAWG